jgi:hypothetical protein
LFVRVAFWAIGPASGAFRAAPAANGHPGAAL